MEKAIRLLSLVNEHDFLSIYFVYHKLKNENVVVSIAFLTKEKAETFRNFLNKINNTNKYNVFETWAHI